MVFDATIAADLSPSVTTSSTARRRRRWPVVAVIAVVLAVAAAGGAYASRSTPTPTIRMPKLVGDTLAQARSLLASDHITVVPSNYAPSKSVPLNQIIHQQPSPGVRVPDGGTIHVLASAGPPPEVVPTVLGRSGPAAVAALSRAGFSATIPFSFAAYSATVPAGRVLAVYSGNTVNPKDAAFGSGLTLALSKGPTPVQLPSEVGQSGQAAVTALHNLGFVTQVSPAFSSSVRAGDVVSTTPGGGTRLQPGKVVKVVISKGAPVAVPSLAGLGLGNAEKAIIRAGLTILAVHGSVRSRDWTTVPPAGTELQQGTGVALYAH
jgi:serine/threonine-protein kinase